MSRVILVVAAHADDEALGCAGTIAKHVACGDCVHVVFVSDGVTSRPRSGKSELTRRRRATRAASDILGITTIKSLGLPDNRLDSIALLDIVQPLEVMLRKLAPEIIYTHHHGDLNIDHRITHQAVMTACRPIPGHPVQEIITFEVMSSTEWSSPGVAPFIPNLFVDISPYMKIKMSALMAYGLEMRTPPHSRNMEHIRCLAQHRGYSVGVDAAEAFMVMRVIRR